MTPERPLHLISAPLLPALPLCGSAGLRETRGKEGNQRPPFPGYNNLAPVLALKAKPSGCAPRSLDRSGPSRRKSSWISGKGGAVQSAVSVQQTFNRRSEVLNTETAEPALLRLEKHGLCSTSLYVPLPD